jgi:hypothetical protein
MVPAHTLNTAERTSHQNPTGPDSPTRRSPRSHISRAAHFRDIFGSGGGGDMWRAVHYPVTGGQLEVPGLNGRRCSAAAGCRASHLCNRPPRAGQVRDPGEDWNQNPNIPPASPPPGCGFADSRGLFPGGHLRRQGMCRRLEGEFGNQDEGAESREGSPTGGLIGTRLDISLRPTAVGQAACRRLLDTGARRGCPNAPLHYQCYPSLRGATLDPPLFSLDLRSICHAGF